MFIGKAYIFTTCGTTKGLIEISYYDYLLDAEGVKQFRVLCNDKSRLLLHKGVWSLPLISQRDVRDSKLSPVIVYSGITLTTSVLAPSLSPSILKS